jgi:hypothetical protein
MITIWAKVVSYHDWHFYDDFIFLTVEIFGCLHHVDDLFQPCANMVWSVNGSIGFPPILCSFYRQRMLVAFQKVQAATILQWVVVIVEKAFSRLDVLLNFSPISLHELLCATSDGFRSLVFLFLFLGSPLCVLHFRVWSFVWTSILSLFNIYIFLLLFTCQVFFLVLNLTIFKEIENTYH